MYRYIMLKGVNVLIAVFYVFGYLSGQVFSFNDERHISVKAGAVQKPSTCDQPF